MYSSLFCFSRTLTVLSSSPAITRIPLSVRRRERSFLLLLVSLQAPTTFHFEPDFSRTTCAIFFLSSFFLSTRPSLVLGRQRRLLVWSPFFFPRFRRPLRRVQVSARGLSLFLDAVLQRTSLPGEIRPRLLSFFPLLEAGVFVQGSVWRCTQFLPP